jgi:hypothetical protein
MPLMAELMDSFSDNPSFRVHSEPPQLLLPLWLVPLMVLVPQ